MDKKSIVWIGLLVEGVLTAIFFVWAYFRGFQDKLLPSLPDASYGLLGAFLLCLVNFFVFGVAAKKVDFLKSSLHFVDHIVKPLADNLGTWSGLFVSICAGVGEELFFRGLLQNEFGLIVASLLFSLLHFGVAVKEYLVVAAFYAIIGLGFGLLYQHFGTLWVPIVMHIAYDFFALLYLKHFYRVSY